MSLTGTDGFIFRPTFDGTVNHFDFNALLTIGSSSYSSLNESLEYDNISIRFERKPQQGVYTLRNNGILTRLISLSVHGDIHWNNDRAPVWNTSTGFSFTDGRTDFNFHIWNYNCPPVDTMWYGFYNYRLSHKFDSGTEYSKTYYPLYDIDSGVIFTWFNRTINPGQELVLWFGYSATYRPNLYPPDLVITTPPKSNYTVNVYPTISISGTVFDRDLYTDDTVYYSFNSGSQVSLGTIYSNTSPTPFSYSISTSSLSPGNHVIYIWANDRLHNSTVYSYNFLLLPNPMNILVTKEPPYSVYHNLNKTLPIKLEAWDTDQTTELQILYKLDSTSYVNIRNITCSVLSKHYSTSFDLFVNNLTTGSHTLYIYATNGSVSSATYSKTFYFYYNSPEIQLTREPLTEYYYQTDHTIEVTMSIKDVDGDENLTIYYYFDSSSSYPVKLENVTIENENSVVTRPYSISIDSLSVSSHSITFFAKDPRNLKSNSITCSFRIRYYDPVLVIVTPPASIYYRKDFPSLTITGRVSDGDGSATITGKYRFDSLSTYSTSSISVPSKTDPVTNTFSISFPYLNNGTHQITFWVTDQYNLVSQTFTYTFTYVLADPTFVITTAPRSTYKNAQDTSISITYNVGHPDPSKTVYIKFKFDSNSYSSMNSYYFSTTTVSTYTYSVSIPSLSYGNHKIYFYALDNEGMFSQTYEYQFFFDYNAPVLEITTAPLSTYRKATSSSISITAKLSDRDGNSVQKFKYQFDSLTATQLTTVNVASGTTPVTQTFSIPFPYLNNGTHTILVWIQDQYNMDSTPLTYTFSYILIDPTFTISTTPLSTYKNVQDTSISITYNVGHADPTKTVYIKYKFDSNAYANLNTHTISSTTVSSITASAAIPALSYGNHKIYFYALDNEGMFSQTYEYQFFFDYNAPVLEITTAPLSSYRKADSTSISITAKLSDRDGNSVQKFKYQFDSLTVTQLTTVNVASGTTPVTQTFSIPFPYLNNGTHTIKVWIEDQYNFESSKFTYTFEYVLITPSLTMITTPLSKYKNVQDTSISITYGISHSDPTKTVYIKYKFDSNAYANLNTHTISSTAQLTQSASITIPALSYGNHKIYFYALDNEGMFSQTYEYQFFFDYNAPVLEITTAPLSTYRKATSSSISITAKLSDRDGNSVQKFKYQFDSLTATQLTTVNVASGTTPVTQTFSIPFPYLNNGTHTILVWIEDQYDFKSSIFSYTFEYVLIDPTFTITTAPRATYKNVQDTSISITYNVGHADPTKTVYIKYKFDSNAYANLNTHTISSTTVSSITASAAIPALSYGNHKIYFYALDNEGMFSQTYEYQFFFDYNAPVLEITTAPLSSYRKADSTSISITAKLSDRDGNSVQKFKYQFDSLTVTQLTTVNVASGTTPVTQTFSIPFPYLNNGTHTIKVWIEDQYNFESSKFTYTFEYVLIDPTFTISTTPLSTYKNVQDTSISITYNVGHADPTKTVYIKYKFDSNAYANLNTHTISSTSQITQTMSITMPSLTYGNHKIYFYALDNEGMFSQTYEYQFFFDYNKPVVTVTKQPVTVFTRFVDTQITFTCSFTDRDGPETLKALYRFDIDTANKTYSNVQITSSTAETSLSFTINFPTNYVSGDHTLSFWASDANNLISNIITFEFEIKRIDPVLQVTKEPSSLFRNNVSTTFSFDVKASHKEGPITDVLKYKLDNNPEIVLDNIYISSMTAFVSKSYSISVHGLSNGTHSIQFWTEYEVNKSQIFTYEFDYVYNAPILEITQSPGSKYIKYVNNTIPISYKVTDIDGPETSVLLYNFDSFQEIKALDFIVETKTSSTTGDYTIVLPDLTVGTHVIQIWVKDKVGYISEIKSYTIDYHISLPVLNLEGLPYFISTFGRNMTVNVTLFHTYGPGNVKFVSYLDNRKNETLNYTANIPYDDGRLISISSIVSVPVPTKTGRHTLYMYVIDATNEVSNIISTTFLFENVFESHLKENHFKRNTRQLLLFSRIVDIE
ncbi:hypothetical protein TVAG_429890 [Trichomonas vaginalis G3]|uniref:Ig-like domain-containing protein n=1 Tax=Trichomonas vaginalis (strain ATCC PRA-98 / G3) TaxID=412133 RepID=A2EI65_TRIV3|nr:hypothetical protein TVAGG3_0858880 [Trichomonas vaginalis G3]EAY07625.1 hypothetical protein TVAG_429890 [Trichomonas vaginalis G3]KAI5500527.1 hypothetical protein TVAGG3_0858880 [Trichomonas vaginalis G3]|eukprot:XP_001319848.1 hypothetical protein [Trichomonas vaginalis G3]